PGNDLLSIDDPRMGGAPNERIVANDANWETGLWSWVTGEERGPTTLSGMDQAIDEQVGEDGKIASFEITGHGAPGIQGAGDSYVTDPMSMRDSDRDALLDIGDHIEDGGEITLGGCNVAEGDEGVETLINLAGATGHPVTAGTSTQLPFP